MKQGREPSSVADEGERGPLLSCGGTLSVPLEWRPVCQELLELQQGCEGPFEVQEGRSDFFRDAAAENVLSSPGGENLMVFLE